MLMKFFSVRDAKTECFLPPFIAHTVGQAERMFADEVQRSGSDFSRHPEDYVLFGIGDYDDLSGLLTAAPQPIQISLALDNVKS